MRVMTIVGTRPELIRLSLIIEQLDQLASRHILVHTGQNFDPRLKDVFFDELGIRQPDHALQHQATSFGQQIGAMFGQVEQLIQAEQPDAILVLGDTNSALCAILAARMHIKVYHMEAGNRCYDLSVPEETNRKIIDAVSHFNLPYTPGSRENLLREGMPPARIWVSGNPIYEVLQHYQSQIAASQIHDKLGIEQNQYFLVTAHRAENVDNKARLNAISAALQEIAETWNLPVVVSVHPRTKARLQQFGIKEAKNVRLIEPFGFFDFVKLQQHARCVLTDSGTVQEESCIFHVPAVTIRQSTERPETILCGSNVLSGLTSAHIVQSTALALQAKRDWPLPEGYEDPLVSSKITKFILGGLTYV